MKIHTVYDNPEYTDRYTVYFKGHGSVLTIQGERQRICLGMSSAPFHPQGICLSGSGVVGKHNGNKIKFEDLPEDCQKAVNNYLNDDY